MIRHPGYLDHASVHLLPEVPESMVIAAANRRAVAVCRASLAAVQDKATLLSEVKRALRCPAYVGNNWDAVDEALRDLAWLPSRARLLLVSDVADFRAECEDLYATLIDVLDSAVTIHRETSTPLNVVLLGVS